MKISYLLYLVLFLSLTSFAQNKNELFIRFNAGRPKEFYEILEYNNQGGVVLFSPAGGLGAEMGIVHSFYKKWAYYSSLGYQHTYDGISLFAINNTSRQSSYAFGRAFVMLGIQFRALIPYSDERVELQSGVGFGIQIPGKMTIVELNVPYPTTSFKPSLGIYFEEGISYNFEKWKIVGTVRYRMAKVRKKSTGNYTAGLLDTEFYEMYPDFIKNVNLTGLDFSISILRRLK